MSGPVSVGQWRVHPDDVGGCWTVCQDWSCEHQHFHYVPFLGVDPRPLPHQLDAARSSNIMSA
jgi:hypothetical protein